MKEEMKKIFGVRFNEDAYKRAEATLRNYKIPVKYPEKLMKTLLEEEIGKEEKKTMEETQVLDQEQKNKALAKRLSERNNWKFWPTDTCMFIKVYKAGKHQGVNSLGYRERQDAWDYLERRLEIVKEESRQKKLRKAERQKNPSDCSEG